jgi:hypothetical protein
MYRCQHTHKEKNPPPWGLMRAPPYIHLSQHNAQRTHLRVPPHQRLHRGEEGTQGHGPVLGAHAALQPLKGLPELLLHGRLRVMGYV